MKVLSKEEFLVGISDWRENIEDGKVFIHPTDTIYGLGCDATNQSAVQKIRQIKNRPNAPLSVIAPGKDWILNHCEVSEHCKEWMQKLPGPYTLVLSLKNDGCIATEVNNGAQTLGVRIPNHWFSQAVQELGYPVITTSANRAGEDFMTNLENLHRDIKADVNFIIYEDEKHGTPSTIVDLTGDEPKILRK